MKKFLLSICLAVASFSATAREALGPRNVHGLFSRTQVLNTSIFRHTITGFIFDTKTKASCTGTLIGPRHVLTAAHCIYNSKTKEWSDGFTFTAGKLSKDDTGLASASFKRFFVQKEHFTSVVEDYDFALVELDSPIGDIVGWAGFRSLSLEESTEGHQIQINLSGYPGDKEFGTLWSVSCPGVVKAALMSYFCDSFFGMSGSAIFQTTDNENFVIGVHTWGGVNGNGGVYINSKNYALLDAWKNGSRYSSNTIIYSKK